MVPQPVHSGVEVVDRPAASSNAIRADATSAALPSGLPAVARWPTGATAATGPAIPGKAWGAKGKARKGQGANVPSGPAVTGQIQQLKEMGFSEKHVREALHECAWDVNKALDLLFTRGTPMEGEGDGEGAVIEEKSTTEARPGTPVSSGKALSSEGAASSGNSPIAESTEQSTTASTASSPRSSACADKSSGHTTGVSAPHSPQLGDDSSGASLAAAAEETVELHMEEQPPVAATTCEEKTEALAEDQKEIVHAEAVSAEEVVEAEAPSAKRLTRVSSVWESQGSGAQMHVKEGDFVSVWPSSVTEHGWIYAEDISHADVAGWLPGCVLEELPSNQRWIKASQEMQAAHETQLSVVEGTVYKVSIDSRTAEGWIYAETSKVTTESAVDGAEEGTQAGWVPVFCFAGSAELEE